MEGVCGGRGWDLQYLAVIWGRRGGDKLGSGKNSKKKRVKNRLLGHDVTMLARVELSRIWKLGEARRGATNICTMYVLLSLQRE